MEFEVIQQNVYWIGTCSDYPNISFRSQNKQDALSGIKKLVKQINKDLNFSPPPLIQYGLMYQGKLLGYSSEFYTGEIDDTFIFTLTEKNKNIWLETSLSKTIKVQQKGARNKWNSSKKNPINPFAGQCVICEVVSTIKPLNLFKSNIKTILEATEDFSVTSYYDEYGRTDIERFEFKKGQLFDADLEDPRIYLRNDGDGWLSLPKDKIKEILVDTELYLPRNPNLPENIRSLTSEEYENIFFQG